MIPPSPFCVTTTPNCFKLAFPYHPRLVELVKRIPSVKQNIRAAYIADEKAWKVSLQDKEYVRMMADWAVQTKICSRVQHKVTTREYNDYTIPDLPKLTVPHGLLLEPYEYQKEGRCVKMRTFFFYAQSPDFHKQGLCYYLKILYL